MRPEAAFRVQQTGHNCQMLHKSSTFPQMDPFQEYERLFEITGSAKASSNLSVWENI